MSNSAYDVFLDEELERYYYEEEDFDVPWPDEPEVIPSDDFDNYDGWDGGYE